MLKEESFKGYASLLMWRQDRVVAKQQVLILSLGFTLACVRFSARNATEATIEVFARGYEVAGLI